ncbi:MAG: class I SAM-dependent methyltransferase [Acidobacteria bacterium]|nr:class I SAM-dependent methyltransferase [Acidobacteriota bacterium]
MADINTPETTDVDVEALMGLIRRRVYGLPDARYIMGEIERARLKADGIVTGRFASAAGPQADGKTDGDARPRPRRLGWKVEVKARVATLIMRAVRMHFRYQEIFNNSVVGVLQLMAEDLYAYERRLDATNRPGEDGRAPAAVFDRAAFEERLLDPQPFARRSLSLFRELLREDDVALELFCGRGELLAAFAASGIEAVGVDPDASMVSLCKGRGLSAIHADIFEHLRDSQDASYGGIFAWKVVERLTNEQTAELLGLVKRKLRHGGLFVASATNIDHLPALRKFYLDPTLVRPVPARLLAFMSEQSGLGIHRFTFSNADGEEMSEPALAREVYPYDEYTVLAVSG